MWFYKQNKRVRSQKYSDFSFMQQIGQLEKIFILEVYVIFECIMMV